MSIDIGQSLKSNCWYLYVCQSDLGLDINRYIVDMLITRVYCSAEHLRKYTIIAHLLVIDRIVWMIYLSSCMIDLASLVIDLSSWTKDLTSSLIRLRSLVIELSSWANKLISWTIDLASLVIRLSSLMIELDSWTIQLSRLVIELNDIFTIKGRVIVRKNTRAFPREVTLAVICVWGSRLNILGLEPAQ